MINIPDKLQFRPDEAARLLGVHVETIRRWIREGKIQAVKSPGGHYRIPRGEAEQVLGERGLFR